MVRIQHEQGDRKGRFVIYEDDKFAGEMTYVWAGNSKLIIDHTGVEGAFGGKGYGKQMVLEAVEFARQNNVKILPLCPFAKAEFEKNESIQDVRI